MRALALAFLLSASTVTGGAFAQGRELPDFTDLAERQGPAVVNISTTQARSRNLPQFPQLDEDDPFYEFFRRFAPRPGPGQPAPGPRQFEQQSLGSGFVISPDGYILTNAHVVDGADEITVKLTDKRELKAKVIGADKRTDVALIKIEAAGLPTVRMGDPTKLRVGEWVVAIGSPFGFENSVTAGIVSAKGRSLPSENFVPFIQTDVAINPGNSGGPLFNLKGEVVGINSQIYSRTGGFMGLSFAIPIDVAMDIQQQLRTSGRVSRGRIGVVIQEVSKDLAESFGLPKPAGALVNQVEKGGPADKAGVLAGDIIVKFDGKSVNQSSDLPRLVGGTKPGTKSTVQVYRKGETKDLTVTVAELPDDRIAARGDGSKPAPKAEVAANRLGLVMSDLPEERRKQLNVAGGAVVDEVKPTARADIRPGDVVLAVTAKGQTTEVKSAEQFNKVLAGIDKAATLTLQIRRGDGNLFVTVKGE
ncbi:MAG: DegQ family serine endoprotease [Burkholderiales bacterium]|jgi:serine protease Do|nr:DegQ family serine endoprotease [Burkholderiales bacterium]